MVTMPPRDGGASAEALRDGSSKNGAEPEAPRLGIPAADTVPALQQDCVKELINKLAWAVGSTYRANYSNMKAPARVLAWRIVKRILSEQGYPSKIGK